VSVARAVSELVGRRLSDAATVRHGFLRFLKGVALRFGDRGLVILAIDCTWTAAAGAMPVERLMDQLGPDRHDELHRNGWLAGARPGPAIDDDLDRDVTRS
jgi:hypothetical protein